MPDISYPASYPPVDGDTTVAADIDALFYQGVLADVAGSLQIVNGVLDSDNIDPSLTITAEMTQRGSFVAIDGASGNANLDYRQNWFGNQEWDEATFSFSDPNQIEAIPGGCRSIFCKWPCKALILWTVYWEWDNFGDDGERSAMQLWIDGSQVTGQQRVLGRVGLTRLAPQGYVKSRFWSGHYFTDLTQGWHNLGLQMQQSKAYQSRVHAVSIRVLQLKYGSAT